MPLQLPHQEERLVSDEMNDYISNRPGWIIRKGNSIFLFVLFILIAMAWLVKYPDRINTSMRIMAVNSPKLLIARTDGKIEQLLVKNDQEVQAGQYIAFLQSTASHEQVLQLFDWVTKTELAIKNGHLENLRTYPLPAFNTLGEMQSFYQDFELIFKETVKTLPAEFYQKKKQVLEKDLADICKIQKIVAKQKALTEEDYNIQEADYKAREPLAKEKVIAPLEFKQEKSKLLNKQQSIEQFSSQLVNNDLSLHGKEKEILELQKQVDDQRQKYIAALFTLKSKLMDWIQHYIVSASVSGKLSYIGFLQEKQHIQVNEELFYIVSDSTRFYGEINSVSKGLGKIRPGQRVIVKVNSYPSNEFGHLSGMISYIPSTIKSDSSLLIKVDFPNGLTTSYGKQLVFKSNMNASADIITSNKRLLKRIFQQVSDLFENE